MQEINFLNAREAEIVQFLKTVVNGSEYFRYFRSRPVSIIKNHLATRLLANKNGVLLAYGHLEAEAEKLWLGLAVADGWHGQGYGTQMLKHLIGVAQSKGANTIYLSVDKDNEAALRLYQKNGFVLYQESETFFLYQLILT